MSLSPPFPPSTHLKPADQTDVQTLALIGSATFLEAFADILPGHDIQDHCARHHSARAYARALRDGARAWLATLASTGAPIGYAMNTAPDLPIDVGPGDLELKRIYVLSKFHGGGPGRDLMEEAISDAKARSAPRLLLGVYKDNHRALAFYRRNGFETVGTRKFQVGDGLYDDLILALRL